MARLSTTADAFNAIAEPRRREIVEYLAVGQDVSVTDLVLKLGLPQPAVSKHLGVLRKVGLVTVEKAGQQRLYNLKADPLKPVHDWVKLFEKFWTDHLLTIKEIAERKARERAGQNKFSNPKQGERS